jgi:nitroimidazol reductase NimA-like FMN-containing flavoprotein (pyridoxamine 5'-phosphate oxidase superfamily)
MDLVTAATKILRENAYMTLGTADESGVPWVSPVWYASIDSREFFWVSDPAARHSLNIAVRPEVSIAIFDSQVPIGTGSGVYMSALASLVPDDDVDHGLAVFSRRSLEQGGREWTRADVSGRSRLRLYRAVVSNCWLGINDRRSPVSLAS